MNIRTRGVQAVSKIVKKAGKARGLICDLNEPQMDTVDSGDSQCCRRGIFRFSVPGLQMTDIETLLSAGGIKASEL